MLVDSSGSKNPYQFNQNHEYASFGLSNLNSTLKDSNLTQITGNNQEFKKAYNQFLSKLPVPIQQSSNISSSISNNHFNVVNNQINVQTNKHSINQSQYNPLINNNLAGFSSTASSIVQNE